MARTRRISPEAQAWKLYRQLVERAWADPAFKARLQKDPKGTLQEAIEVAGLDIPLPKRIKFIADTEKTANFTLPLPGIIIC